jgi:hypothetical protein
MGILTPGHLSEGPEKEEADLLVVNRRQSRINNWSVGDLDGY